MTATLSEERRARLRRRVRWIVGFTISYNVIEAVIAIWAGSVASSAALIGFGLDSIIEVLSAAAVAWQFTRKDPERWERITVRVVAIAFFALAAYVSVDAVLALVGVTEPEHSPVGIAIAALSVVIMPALAWLETRTGKELRSASVQADAKQLLVCTYLSAAVLLGLLANSLLGWWWADSVAALVVAGLAIREGIEAWRGDLCCAPSFGEHEHAHDHGVEAQRERSEESSGACCGSCVVEPSR
ncbi:cation diffusion facilitator family transporter [Agrococcus jenensis]|uniref:Cation efflux family protein n=1 Tax=Agrococcus jenensis TaxID=46353 RepID=A0A3N2AQ50_9MICO|nr:cation transporter [Agrococcus jenensis]ROR65181.1 cation efflux family protein [Agrococcus jenensis]